MTAAIILYLVVVAAFFGLLMGLSSLQAEIAARRAEAPAAVLRRRTLADGLSPWVLDLVSFALVAKFEALVSTSGLAKTPQAVVVFMGVLTTLATFGFTAWGLGAWSVVIGLILGCALPLHVLARMRKKRFVKIGAQLPEALDMLVRSLRAGHPVPTGIRMIATEMPAPIGGEFRLVHESMAYGLDLREALERMALRLHIAEISYMVTAIRIQHTSGGNLSEVLSTLAKVIREREKLKLKVQALSAESRLSGNILSVLPFVLVLGFNWINPNYYQEVWKQPAQLYLMGFALFLAATGVVLIGRIVKIRV